MMAEFTKGPWEVDVDFNQSNEFTVDTVANESGEYFKVCGGIEDRANANLIASAPELYNAIEMVFNRIPLTPSVHGAAYSVILTQEEVDQIRQALTKARGE